MRTVAEVGASLPGTGPPLRGRDRVIDVSDRMCVIV